MKQTLHTFLIALMVITSANSIAKTLTTDELKHLLDKAIAKQEQTNQADWRYKVKRFENEEGDITSSVEVYDPRLLNEQQWSLLKINGQIPTNEQKEEFIKEKLKAANENAAENQISIKLRKLIKFESVQLESSNEEYFYIRFNVAFKRLGKGAENKLTGLLLYNRSHKFIEKIEISNTEPFSPMFAATINDLNLTLIFTQIDNHVLPLQHDLNLKGTFAYFSEINEVSSDVFLNYVKIEP